MASSSIDGSYSRLGLPKGLALAHLNICSLRNKTHELKLMAITETHLDSTFDDSLISIEGSCSEKTEVDTAGAWQSM